MDRPKNLHNSCQNTLARAVSIEGLGVHTGKSVFLSIHPARENSGILFERNDLPGLPLLPARPEYLVDSTRCTALERGSVRVSTVEHILAALWMLGIDNAVISLDGEEVPILDGSAAPFVKLIREVGLRVQKSPRVLWNVTQPVKVRDGDRSCTLLPAKELAVDCLIDFDHPLIASQRLHHLPSIDHFAEEIAPARTFVMLRDVTRLQRAGLARGGSLKNAVVVDSFSVLNPEGLRFADEFVRHKILDILGDFALLGGRLNARVVAVKSGHHLHHLALQKLLEQPNAYTCIPAFPVERENVAFGNLVRGLQGA